MVITMPHHFDILQIHETSIIFIFCYLFFFFIFSGFKVFENNEGPDCLRRVSEYPLFTLDTSFTPDKKEEFCSTFTLEQTGEDGSYQVGGMAQLWVHPNAPGTT